MVFVPTVLHTFARYTEREKYESTVFYFFIIFAAVLHHVFCIEDVLVRFSKIKKLKIT